MSHLPLIEEDLAQPQRQAPDGCEGNTLLRPAVQHYRIHRRSLCLFDHNRVLFCADH